MERISIKQLSSLIILFGLGASTLFPIGIAAKQDAWIVIVLSLICSFILFYVFANLHKMYPNKSIIQIIFSIVGEKFGKPLALMYTLFFFNATARSLSDFGLVINITILNKTPELIINIAFVIVTLYILFLGFEVLGRMAQVLVVIEVFILFMIYFLVFVNGELNFSEMLPILGDGWAPVLKAIPATIEFPFSEIFVFLVFTDLVVPNKDCCKYYYLSLIFIGIMILLSTTIMIASLGPTYSDISTYPLLDIIRMINIEEIISNLDSVSTLIVFIGGFIKEIVYFFATVTCFCYTFNIKKKRIAYIAIGIVLLWYTHIFEKSYPEHIFIGLKIIPKYASVFYFIIIPILIFLISKVKNSMRNSVMKNSE